MFRARWLGKIFRMVPRARKRRSRINHFFFPHLQIQLGSLQPLGISLLGLQFVQVFLLHRPTSHHQLRIFFHNHPWLESFFLNFPTLLTTITYCTRNCNRPLGICRMNNNLHHKRSRNIRNFHSCNRLQRAR